MFWLLQLQNERREKEKARDKQSVLRQEVLTEPAPLETQASPAPPTPPAPPAEELVDTKHVPEVAVSTISCLDYNQIRKF